MENPDIPIANDRQVKVFERSLKAKDGPSLDDIYFDFDHPSPFTPWNARIALLLAKKYVAERGAYVKDVTIVQKAFMQRLRKLHAAYQKALREGLSDQLAEEARKRALARKGRQYFVSHSTYQCRLFDLTSPWSNEPGANELLDLWRIKGLRWPN